MEQILNNIVAQWGAIGLLIGFLIVAAVFMWRHISMMQQMLKESSMAHAAERKEWMDFVREQSEKSNEAINNNTAVLNRIEAKIR